MTKAKDITLAVWVGHGKSTDGSWDPGCTYGDYTEADLLLPIVRHAVAALRRCGFVVLTDAYNANNINMIKQVEKSNEKGVDAHLSFHLDWSGAPKGTYPIVASKAGKALAKDINKYVKKRTGMTTRGFLVSSNYYETNATDMPAVIYECGSIKADLTRIKKAKVYGEAIAEGICAHYGVPYAKDVPFLVKTKGKLIIRKTSSLTSKRIGKTEKGGVYTIVKVTSNGNRGKLKSGAGWITITDKYCEKL